MLGISYAIFLFGGGLYTLNKKPTPSYYDRNKFYFLDPTGIKLSIRLRHNNISNTLCVGIRRFTFHLSEYKERI